MDGVQLQPEHDVLEMNGRWLATSGAPWLAAPSLARFNGRWIRLRYRAGLFDEMVRPLIRFRLRDGVERIVPMNGAPTGMAEWIGRVPERAVAVSISPVRTAGEFSFELSDAIAQSRLALVLRGLWRQPRMALTALGARLIGSREEARHCLKFAALPSPMHAYENWIRARTRPMDLQRFDRPHADLQRAPVVHLLLRASSDTAGIEHMLASLRAQSYAAWKLYHLGLPTPAWTLAAAGDRRLIAGAREVRLGAIGVPGDLIATIEAGDVLLPHALAMVVDHALARPAMAICYGDEEDEADADVRPRFKPDFSATFEEATGYIGDGAFVRLGWLAEAGDGTLAEVAEAPTPATGLTDGAVVHLRRLLHRRRFRPSRRAPAVVRSAMIYPEAAIVVPTRDRADLLRTCLDTVLSRTDYPIASLVIVDNGTTDRAALALLDEAAREPTVRLLRAPGPFNYAALCNRGAAASSAPLLVFLNNDVSAIDGGWLRHLAAAALEPTVGAVGPKLLFPDGRVQHGGDVLGLGETALHAYRLAADGAGYLGQLDAPHEAAAVTGAVQVIERWKFDQVGGFDAERFPVLLNDTDLCLRLAERGWLSRYVPAATMVHAESASRGYLVRPLTHYAPERAAFGARWLAAIRDDPFFHPALSLFSCDPALG